MEFFVDNTVYKRSSALSGVMASGRVVEKRSVFVAGAPAGNVPIARVYRVYGHEFWQQEFWDENDLLGEAEACQVVKAYWQGRIDYANRQISSLPC